LQWANFISLAEGKVRLVSRYSLKGKNYYDGLNLSQSYERFMISKGGDPSGNGTGGPGYRFW